jgi:hypothetical protein
MLTEFGCVIIVSNRQKVLEWQAPPMYYQILHELMNPDIWSNKCTNKHVMEAIRTVNAISSVAD